MRLMHYYNNRAGTGMNCVFHWFIGISGFSGFESLVSFGWITSNGYFVIDLDNTNCD